MNKTLIIICLFIAACATTKKVVTGPSQTDVDRVSVKYPGYTLAQLKEGQVLYEQHCQSCHGLINVRSGTEETWKAIVPKMVIKVNKKAGMQVIDAAREESILRYTITMNSAPAQY